MKKPLVICFHGASRGLSLNIIQGVIRQKRTSVWLCINHVQSLFSVAARQPAYLNIVKQDRGHGPTTECLAALQVAVTNEER